MGGSDAHFTSSSPRYRSTRQRSANTMEAFRQYSKTTGENPRNRWAVIPDKYPVKIIIRKAGLLPPAERLRRLLAIAKGHALPKQINMNASNSSMGIGSSFSDRAPVSWRFICAVALMGMVAHGERDCRQEPNYRGRVVFGCQRRLAQPRLLGFGCGDKSPRA